MINTILAACVFSCCISCNSGKLVKTENSSDTTLLSRIDKPPVIGAAPAVLPFTFSANSRNLFNSNKKTWLQFGGPQLIEAPDGVYEIYLTGQPPQTSNLSAIDPAFVNVLDLYSITAPGAKQLIEVDISSHIKNIFLQKQPVQAIYVTLVFSGNKLTDGSRSTKAGKLRLGSIQILQTKE